MIRTPADIPKTLISVCICTFKRLHLLSRTLDGVLAQSDGSAVKEVVVVDNDRARSAQGLVEQYVARGTLRIIYDCEPEQNIALARNRAVRNASGPLIAFIDDDEFPADDKLYQRMFRCLKKSGADAVLGPVLPHFPTGAPVWLVKSGLCERPRSATGSPVRGKDLRTGNILLDRQVFEDKEKWFDPELGLSGGSDGEFLWRQVQKGRKMVWCDEAVVFETVPPERWSAGYYLRRNFRVGIGTGLFYRRSRRFGSAGISGLLLSGYAVLLPFAAIGGQRIWMKMLVRIFNHLGCLLAFVVLVRMPQRR